MKTIQNIAKCRAKSKKQKYAQKQARKIQRKNKQRKQHRSRGKKLTPEEKEKRRKQLAARKEAKKKRMELDKNKKEGKKVGVIQNTLFSILNHEMLDGLAKQVGFIKRRGGEITAFSFMYVVSFGFLGNGIIALPYLTASLLMHFNVNVTPQALSKRVNSASSVKFLKTVLTKLLEGQLKIGLKNSFSKAFPMFRGIYLQDSTQITLNETLSENFKGPGGSASKSAMKIDFIYDIANLLVKGVKITSATINDQTLSRDILKYVKKRSLIIRDLGYFSIDVLKNIGEKLGFYITRVPISTNVYLHRDDKEPLDLPKYLKELKKQGKDSSNIKVYIGKEERLETRLVAEKVPARVVKQRVARFKEDRRKNPSPYYTAWCGFSIFITNIPETMFSGEMIITLYKIRWQIELIFKNLKSNVEIDVIKGKNKYRVESLVYGRLITVVIIVIIQNYAANIAGDKEISGDKIVKLLKTDNRLQQAVIKTDITMLLMVLERDIILICKKKRSRKTTYEIIKETLAKKKKGKSSIVPLQAHMESEFEENYVQDAI